MFRDPWHLLLGAALAAAVLLAHKTAAGRRKRLSQKLGDLGTLDRLLSQAAPRRRGFQAALRAAGVLLIGVALAGPQWGVELAETATRARDVMIVVDVSQSMLAEDVRPDRLSRAKAELALLIDELRGARVGVIAFAGEPLVVCPLTTDAAAAKQLLRSLDPSAVAVPGSGIGKAVRRAVQSLARYPGAGSIVLLTDGEDHKTDPRGAAEEAAAEGVRIFAIGIGTSEGQPIPLKDESGRLTGYKKDRRGGTVVSRLGEADLSAMAQATGGAYYRSTPGAAEASEIARAILGTGTEAEAKTGSTRRYRNRYLIPLLLAFIILLLEWVVPETPRPAPGRGAAAAGVLAAIVLVCAAPASAATAESALRKGNRHYAKGHYDRALEQYGAAAKRSPRDRRPVFNAGAALYKLEQHDKAAEAFSAVAESGGPAEVQSDAYYNLGNARFRKGDYAQAVAAYRKALVLDPTDVQARDNLAVALRRMKDPPPKPPKDPKSKPQEQDKQKDEKDPEKDKSGGGQPPPQQPKTRPQDQISEEDAERIMRAVKERERSTPRRLEKGKGRKPDVEEDW